MFKEMCHKIAGNIIAFIMVIQVYNQISYNFMIMNSIPEIRLMHPYLYIKHKGKYIDD